MCLFPKFIKNKKYLPNKKNNFTPPKLKDLRVSLVPVGCGKCMECLQQKARQWQVRLAEHLTEQKNAIFITLTFSDESIKQLTKELSIKESNALATIAVRRFLERWRKKYKKSIEHWLVTELGGENDRIHLHGILFLEDKKQQESIVDIWKYGHIFIGNYCNLKTINYIIKYVHKIDIKHKGYVPIVLCSKGIGKGYLQKLRTQQQHTFKDEKTQEYYRLKNGCKVNLPIYYRNKLFNEQQREQLWIHRIEKGERFVCGIKIDNFNTKEGYDRYMRILERAQEQNKKLGFGDDTEEWKKKEYNVTIKMLNKKLKDIKVAKS